MAFEDGVWVGVGVAAVVIVAGVITFKVLKKKRPKVIEKAAKSVISAKKKTADVAKSAKDAFREGYETAKTKAKDNAPATAAAVAGA